MGFVDTKVVDGPAVVVVASESETRVTVVVRYMVEKEVMVDVDGATAATAATALTVVIIATVTTSGATTCTASAVVVSTLVVVGIVVDE